MKGPSFPITSHVSKLKRYANENVNWTGGRVSWDWIVSFMGPLEGEKVYISTIWLSFGRVVLFVQSCICLKVVVVGCIFGCARVSWEWMVPFIGLVTAPWGEKTYLGTWERPAALVEMEREPNICGGVILPSIHCQSHLCDCGIFLRMSLYWDT